VTPSAALVSAAPQPFRLHKMAVADIRKLRCLCVAVSFERAPSKGRPILDLGANLGNEIAKSGIKVGQNDVV
jgi:hypothetical protein